MPGIKSYSGIAPTTTLSGSISASDLSISIASGTGYPTGAGSKPFVIDIDNGTASEEKILCDSRSGTTITVNASGRGYDGTTATTHASSAEVRHVLDADTITEANAHVNDDTRDDHSQYLDTTRHAAVVHTAAMLGTGSVDSDEIVAGAVDLAHMSANSVDSTQIVAGAVDLTHMSANSVDSDQYVDGSIDTAHYAAGSVDATALGSAAVTLVKVHAATRAFSVLNAQVMA